MIGSSPTVFVIDDDSDVRSSLRNLFQLENMRVQLFSTAEEFLSMRAYKRPACIVSDIRMPGMSGMDLQKKCEENGISMPLIFITGHGNISMGVLAMKNGAIEFLEKPYDGDDLLRAVNQAIDKDRLGLQKQRRYLRVKQRLEKLSAREQQVLQGVVSGLLNKQIAIKMGITEKTVKFHRAHVMEKMKAGSISHLIRLAEVVGVLSRLKIPVG